MSFKITEEAMRKVVRTGNVSDECDRAEFISTLKATGFGLDEASEPWSPRAMAASRATLRSPLMPLPIMGSGTRREPGLDSSQLCASSGDGRCDAPSGSQKRRNKSPHSHGREPKLAKRSDTSLPKRHGAKWIPGGIRVTGTELSVNDADSANYFGPFLGVTGERIAAITTGETSDAAVCLISAYKEAKKQNNGREIQTFFIPIDRNSVLTPQTSGGRAAKTPQAGPRTLRLQRLTEKPRRQEKVWTSSRPSPPAACLRTIAQGGQDRGDDFIASRDTAGPREDALAGQKGNEDELFDLTEIQQQVDLTGPDSEPTCDICHRNGTHTTGRCAMVTSLVHGDTNTDPFCNISASAIPRPPGQKTHALQGPQKGTFNIACPIMNAHWENYEIQIVWRKLVVERRRMPPLAAYTADFCFVYLTIAFSQFMHGNTLPPEMNGIWPYTKADALKYKNECDRFWEIGMENMPPGELEGLTMDEIRQGYGDGRIKPQVRWTAADNKQAALRPAEVRRGGGNGPDKVTKQPRTTGASGTAFMGGQPSARLGVPISGSSKSRESGAAGLRPGGDEGITGARMSQLKSVKGRMPRRLQDELEREEKNSEAEAEKKEAERHAARMKRR